MATPLRSSTLFLSTLLSTAAFAEAPAADSKSDAEVQKALQADQQAQQAAQPAAAPPAMSLGPRGTQSLNPDLSLIGDFAAAAFSDPAPPQLGGHDPHGNGFQMQALEMTLGASVDPYLRMDTNIAFSINGVEIEEAYATSLALPLNLQIRAGQFLNRFGRINTMHPHTWDFVDQPVVMGKFLGGDGNRGRGFETSALLSFVPWYTEVVVSAMSAGVPGEDERSFLGQSGKLVASPLDLLYMGALKQFFPIADDVSLAWGLSTLSGPNDFGLHGRTEIYGTDIYLKYRPVGEASSTIVSLTVEALIRRRHALDGLNAELVDAGGYAQLFWRWAQEWGGAIRGDYVSGLSGDPLDSDWALARSRVSASITFWPSEFSRVRLQANYDRPQADAVPPVTSVILAFEFAAGAHGAHQF